MTWNPYILPVRALGKCGGYDSDIMAGMRWAAGLTVTNADGTPVIDNPFPVDIINLSLGGSGTCPSSYQSLITTLTGMGVLTVVSAGNASGPVDSPANCAGVLAVAGLRNVGTKVGYSSLGPEVGVAAPAGYRVDTTGTTCLRSIDTTTNSGATTPLANTYTNELNPNLGTSFSAPIVSGVAALMRAVNGNLTPAQLIARIEASATPYPPAGGHTGVFRHHLIQRRVRLYHRGVRRRHAERLQCREGGAQSNCRREDSQWFERQCGRHFQRRWQCGRLQCRRAPELCLEHDRFGADCLRRHHGASHREMERGRNLVGKSD